jgi:hypothetical protein
MKVIQKTLASWKMLKPIIRNIFLVALIVIIVTLGIIIIYPTWLTTPGWRLLLVIPVILSVLTIISTVIAVFGPIVNSIRNVAKIQNAFKRVTNNSQRVLKPGLVGIPNLIQRSETVQIFDYIKNGKSVLLTGEAGAGKSGIATAIVVKAEETGHFSILIDARRIIDVQSPGDLPSFFELKDSVIDSINVLTEDYLVIVIVDQIDNIAGLPSSGILTDLLINCIDNPRVRAVAISRHNEGNEGGALQPLVNAGFINMVCPKISEELATEILQQVGFTTIQPSLLELTKNLLNLDIVCEIARSATLDELTVIEDEFTLWDKYRETLIARENSTLINGHTFIVEAIRLATLGLQAANRSFELSYPLTQIQTRLVSGNIINKISGRRYQFTIEKLQDYLCAWEACEREFDLESVTQEIGDWHRRNVIVWMRDIYHATNHPNYEMFLDEVLSG